MLAGCNGDAPESKRSERLSDSQLVLIKAPAASGFIFSFDLRSSPQEDARQYQPLLDYLHKRTGYDFTMRFTSREESLAAELESGRIHLAAVGAVTYLQAAAKQPAVMPIVRGKNHFDEGSYRSIFVVSPDSAIASIEGLRDKHLAFGAIDSTQGHLIPRIMLAQKGITLQQLAKYEYTGSHQNCADAVLSGKFDACGMQDTLAVRLAENKQLRILQKSDLYPSSGIVSGPALPSEAREKIRKALLDFDPLGRDKPDLYHWDRTEMPNGFMAANASDYDELKTWLVRLELIDVKPSKQQ